MDLGLIDLGPMDLDPFDSYRGFYHEDKRQLYR